MAIGSFQEKRVTMCLNWWSRIHCTRLFQKISLLSFLLNFWPFQISFMEGIWDHASFGVALYFVDHFVHCSATVYLILSYFRDLHHFYGAWTDQCACHRTRWVSVTNPCRVLFVYVSYKMYVIHLRTMGDSIEIIMTQPKDNFPKNSSFALHAIDFNINWSFVTIAYTNPNVKHYQKFFHTSWPQTWCFC